jgi:hypothetical protein
MPHLPHSAGALALERPNIFATPIPRSSAGGRGPFDEVPTGSPEVCLKELDGGAHPSNARAIHAFVAAAVPAIVVLVLALPAAAPDTARSVRARPATENHGPHAAHPRARHRAVRAPRRRTPNHRRRHDHRGVQPRAHSRQWTPAAPPPAAAAPSPERKAAPSVAAPAPPPPPVVRPPARQPKPVPAGAPPEFM